MRHAAQTISWGELEYTQTGRELRTMDAWNHGRIDGLIYGEWLMREMNRARARFKWTIDAPCERCPDLKCKRHGAAVYQSIFVRPYRYECPECEHEQERHNLDLRERWKRERTLIPIRDRRRIAPYRGYMTTPYLCRLANWAERYLSDDSNPPTTGTYMAKLHGECSQSSMLDALGILRKCGLATFDKSQSVWIWTGGKGASA